ncbi:MAG: tetratricopeptide repeat protein [Proteobacteria bacterium]|nr:tetratricopeptide repeat protein [Pseudomonadota bacterium]
MAPVKLIKHNPMFLSETGLESSFVVREAELGSLLRIVRENDGPTNQHVIVIGTRGMGKTMLVRRLALAIQKDALLGRKWYPSVLSEEIYDVASEGELWLRVLERIAIQEREAKRDHLRWLQRYETLRKEMDGKRLKVQALAALSEFATERCAKLLVVVENLQMLLGEQSGINDAWDLRQTLLNNPEVMLVATATMRFGEIMNADKANYELFREITLAPLSTDDCRVLWHYITGEELADERIRPMEILTGGSPRLLAILADFAKGRSLAELMDDLVILIDDHTTYFKANVESLPPMERRVFVTLAEIWEPAEARQVSERCRLSVNTTSATLKKLVGKGAVAEAGKVGRKNLYQIVERLYNIYHLMRLSGVEADRVRALVRFMVPLYGKERVACALADEACSHEREGRLSWIEGYRVILAEASHEKGGLDRLFRATPAAFLKLPEASEVINQYRMRPAEAEMQDNEAKLWDRASTAFEKGDFQQAVGAMDSILEHYRKSGSDEPKARLGIARALVNKGITLGSLGQGEDEITVYDEVISRFGDAEELPLRERVARALMNKGITLGSLGRGEDEITVYDEVISRFGNVEEFPLRNGVACALVNKGVALGRLGRGDDAITVCDEVINLFGDAEELPFRDGVALALLNKGVALGSLGRAEEEIAVYDEVISRFGNAEELPLRERVARALMNKRVALESLARGEDAIAVCDEVISRFGNAEELPLRKQVACALNGKAWKVYEIGNYLEVDQAIADVEKAISIMPQNMAFHHTLACLLGLASRWEEAFKHAKFFSDDKDMVEKCSQDILAFFVDATAAGQAEPALLAIEGTKSEPAMEPLVVALKVSADKPYRAPREVVEMANDIQRRILQRKDVLRSRMVK